MKDVGISQEDYGNNQTRGKMPNRLRVVGRWKQKSKWPGRGWGDLVPHSPDGLERTRLGKVLM